MAKKKPAKAMPAATFEVKFVGPNVLPEDIPLRAVSDALSAVQDLASGRDPFEDQHVPADKAIGLLNVRRGSAVYRCVARSPELAIANLLRIAAILSSLDESGEEDDVLTTAIRPIKSLSDVAKSVDCTVQIRLIDHRASPLFSIDKDDYQRISERLFVTGDTTIVGRVERAGGATEMKCLLRVPGRRRGLYCDVASQDLVRRLGQHLYEDIAATGTAIWINRSWRIHQFTINDFAQPRLENVAKAIKDLRGAGLSAWDNIDDPESYIQELR